MNFDAPLVPARLIRRYKRFLADVVLDTGETVTAHCANPGSMLGLAPEGARVFLSPARDPKRKLRWSWRLVEIGGALVGIDTGLANVVVAEAVAAGRIPALAGYGDLRREVPYGRNSRIDLLLSDAAAGGPDCLVEVKSVTLSRRPGLAEFPDSVTARGAKHLDELAEAVAGGRRAVLLYLVQRTDATRFAVAADIDPAYDRAYRDARARGVEVLCHACRIDPAGITLDRALPVD
ncbi:DNA/RNA nuclease SfsA [Zavarzinia compransoris]|uniref:Sugar fermentation stimulation protein homolog n=1 Tax=Zavarzinia compransoris TaxID=1264899 RepID=A0A317E9Y1_9PROT|nr:DNA/RNA nuclease SfsA [Zavarzinia compransoris]PWR23927.1 DNA/RNA nuclease SfsA [Zavarzinia compransoris]TDP48172.1 sugar fermentation stimulation protein A [Zavarzinia compransoris]